MLSNAEKLKIAEERLDDIDCRAKAIVKEYKEAYKFEGCWVSPEGRVTKSYSISIKDRDRFQYLLKLCAIERRAIVEEIYRLNGW